jgi:hypothetical protein
MATASLPPGFGGPVLGLPADQMGQNISLHHLRHHLQQARVSKKVSWAAGDRLCQVIPFFLLLHSCGDLSCKLHASFVLVPFSSSSSSSIKNRSSLFFSHGFSSSTGAGYHPSLCLSSSAWRASTAMFDFPIKRSSRWIEGTTYQNSRSQRKSSSSLSVINRIL